jgi:hypothetical protein
MDTTQTFYSDSIRDANGYTLKQKFQELVARSNRTKGTNYYKVFILGNTGIYYAHPEYGHADYNKHRVCDITPYTKRLMRKSIHELQTANHVHYISINQHTDEQ